MPTHLDFDSTKAFRDVLIKKTLNTPNGPQTFTSQNFIYQKPSDYSNVDPGDVTTDLDKRLLKHQSKNIFKPINYWVTEYLRDIPRRANLNLYPYFVYNRHSLISIMAQDNYDTESELMKFAASNIKNNKEGPVLARIQQNLYAATVGRVRLIDALEGNLSTAINLVTGREPLIEYNTKITVAKTLPGKAIDFLQTVAGIELPFSEIPGDYLSNPRRPVVNRPEATTEGQSVWQDITGAVGSMFGIQRRPLDSRKPSDLFLDYTGQGSKQVLYDNLSYSKYAPNYTTSARSQNTSKIFSFVDKIGEGVNKLLGLEAPEGVAYIGDDRGNDAKYSMGDLNDNIVRGPWYLSLMFDPVQARMFQKERNITEGGEIGGRLIWISKNSKNKYGIHNEEYSTESSNFENGISTKYTFRDGSILGRTQDLLNTMPLGGEGRSHVGNAIDQTSRIFRQGDVMISRGSAIKYIDQFSQEESGVEYCRVWTKDRSYYNYSDLMKRTKLIRNITENGASVLNTPYNLNIYPNSDGKGNFPGDSNIQKREDGFYAKKYMFSIENLAWKTSNTPGFLYTDLPYCERGPNYGRIMWFPPYDLKVTEQNSARWEENNFLGRPEPVYTYQNTTRSGNISFKVIVDHPSVLNLLTKEHFKDMSNEEADNYINAFFAGCQDVDFYDLIRKYTTLDTSDVIKIQDYLKYLNGGNDPNMVISYKSYIEDIKDDNKPDQQTSTGGNGFGDNVGSGVDTTNKFSTVLYFPNDIPKDNPNKTSNTDYTTDYNSYIASESEYIEDLITGLERLIHTENSDINRNDAQLTFQNLPDNMFYDSTKMTGWTGSTINLVRRQFDELESNFSSYDSKLSEIKRLLGERKIKEVKIKLESVCSSVADNQYNDLLSYRRSHSIIKDIIKKLNISEATLPDISWPSDSTQIQPIPLKRLGYNNLEGNLIFEKINNLGETKWGTTISSGHDCFGKNFIIPQLRKTAPITFYCRQTKVDIDTIVKGENDKPQGTVTPLIENNPEVKKITLVGETKPVGQRRPPQDELKRIIMKTLSECYYFKKFEEDSPMAFNSMRETLRYFHPAFHSMTPEGLNARLTFLHQCIRPGDTMPIKGISDVSDLNARNTTFGPPPICVLRIGDFYHSKIIIRDINIEFDENIWDLNPEGIGIQPMIANVTLQVSFIGGHGLEKPVEMLQNALSSNFYANTEMYDHRAVATEIKTGYTKTFLETLTMPGSSVLIPTTNVNSSDNVAAGQYIGVKTSVYSDSTLEYTKLVDDVHTQLEEYFTAHRDSLENISSKYGRRISSIFFSPVYRTVKNFEVFQDTSTSSVIELLGEFESKNRDLSYYLSNFDNTMNKKTADTNITGLIGLDREFNDGLKIKSEQILKSFIQGKIKIWVEDFLTEPSIKGVEKSRNKLISTLDKLNFVIHYEADGYITVDDKAVGVNYNTFTNFYEKYEKVVEHISDHYLKFKEDLDISYVFAAGGTMSDDVYSELLSILLYDDKEDILDLYRKEPLFTKHLKKIESKLSKFLELPNPIDIELDKFPKKKNNNPIIFTIQDELRTFDETQKQDLKNIMSNKLPLGTTLNFYKP